MKIKSLINCIIIVALLICVIIPEAMANENNDQIVWKLGHVEVPDVYNQFIHTMSYVFKNYVEVRSGGKVKVEIYPGSQLGLDTELVEQVKIGTIQVAGVGEGGIAPFYEPIQSLLIPFLFKSESVVWEVLDGPFGKELFDDMANTTGLRIVSTGRGLFRHFTNNVKPIHNPDDLKGIKFRTMTVPLTVEMVKALGGAATPIPWADLYNALQMNVVEGQENPVSVIRGGNLYEVQKYLTLDGHQFGGNYLVVNEQWYQNLSPDLKKVVKDATYLASLAGRGTALTSDAVSLEFLKEKGMEVYAPTPEELAQFKEISQPPVIEWFVENIDSDRRWTDKLFKAIEVAEKELEI